MPSITPPQMADRLQKEGQTTVEFFQTLPAEMWTQQVYTDGENWTIHQILTHLTQAEDSILRLVAHVVKGGAGSPEDLDLDAYNHKKVKEMEAKTSGELIEEFSHRRARTIDFIGKLKDEDFDKVGRHAYLGTSTIEEMLKLMYLHTQLHRRDIRKLLDN